MLNTHFFTIYINTAIYNILSYASKSLIIIVEGNFYKKKAFGIDYVKKLVTELIQKLE